jgi:hypothetical protein
MFRISRANCYLANNLLARLDQLIISWRLSMVPLKQFEGDIGFVLYSSSLKKSMAATTIGGCDAICEGDRDLEEAT